MTDQPTIKERLQWVKDPEELPGFSDQLERDGRLDARAKNLIAIRRAELTR